MKNIPRQLGFTLIELLLYVGIASVILSVTSVLLAGLVQSRVKNQVISEVEQQGIQMMQVISQSIRNADAVVTPPTGGSASSLSLTTISAASSPTVFDISNGVLRIKEGNGAVLALTNSRVTVSGLTFQNLSRANTPGIIRIAFTLTHSNPEGRNEYDFSKVFFGSASLR